MGHVDIKISDRFRFSVIGDTISFSVVLGICVEFGICIDAWVFFLIFLERILAGVAHWQAVSTYAITLHLRLTGSALFRIPDTVTMVEASVVTAAAAIVLLLFPHSESPDQDAVGEVGR